MTPELIASPRPRRHPVDEHDGPPGFAARVVTALIVGIPFVALVLGVIRFWGRGIHLRDVLLAAAFYLLIGHGMTIGFHRLLAHKSFTARRPIKLILVAFGSMAYEGGPVGWVANHLRHHVVADTASDPHSPQHHGGGVHGQLKASGTPTSAGCSPPATHRRAATPLHHATWSVNSLCHMFGRRPFATKDRSRNVAALAILSMGESWHNGHHAFPRSARHGLLRGQWDTSAMLIRVLERTALLHDVHWPSAEAVRNRSLAIGTQPPVQCGANVAGGGSAIDAGVDHPAVFECVAAADVHDLRVEPPTIVATREGA